MAVRFTDNQIQEMLTEIKILPNDWKQSLSLKPKKLGHDESQLDIVGEKGNNFRIKMRLSQFDPLSFSVILCFCLKETNFLFRLCRYNGKHQHTNTIEKQTFFEFHIHYATQRYQGLGVKEDFYAEPSNKYSDIYSALDCLLSDCFFISENDAQLDLFQPGGKK